MTDIVPELLDKIQKEFSEKLKNNADIARIEKLIPWIKAKVSAENIEKAKNLVMLAVQAAEQIFGPGKGEEKFNYVVSPLAGIIKIDEAKLKNMIEAAVLELGKSI